MEKSKVAHIVLIGLPGCGKGTQASMLKERYNAVVVSTGTILRNKAMTDTPIGNQIKDTINAGKLVDAAIVNSAIQDFIIEKFHGSYDLFVWDGYPRNCEQSVKFLELLDETGIQRSLVTAIYIELNAQDATDRLLNRLQCANCDAVYNTKSDHVYDGLSKCTKCGTLLSKRADDKKHIIDKRTEASQIELGKVADFLHINGINVVEIDGSLSREEIFGSISLYCKY